MERAFDHVGGWGGSGWLERLSWNTPGWGADAPADPSADPPPDPPADPPAGPLPPDRRHCLVLT